jgi:chromate transporter
MAQRTKNVTNVDLLRVFLKLGTIGFGGPAAHIALMREEVVEKRGWLGKDEFFDLVGATNLIPGPNSTELAIHVGHRLGGWPGLAIAGAAFILPAFLSVFALAVLYVRFGTLPALGPVLSGIRPVIVAIVFLALMKFRESAVRGPREAAVAALALGLAYLGFSEVAVIFLAGALLAGAGKFSVAPLALAAPTAPAAGGGVFLFFLKVGSVLFGSGYVLLAFLKNELVDERGWLTATQLLDAVSVGQFTPGPVFTTATFIGYLLQGGTGAVLATLGIFLPSFVFVAASAPFLPRLRSSPGLSRFLDGVNAASFALMALVTVELGAKSVVSYPTAAIALAALGVLKFTRLNSAWPILAGGLVGALALR